MNLRKATNADIQLGVFLRNIQEDGSSKPFSDVVVTEMLVMQNGDVAFTVKHPYASSYNHDCSKYMSNLDRNNYHVYLDEKGNPLVRSY